MNIPKRIKISRIEKDILNAILELMVVESLGRILQNNVVEKPFNLKSYDVGNLITVLNISIEKVQKILARVEGVLII